jgi:hypothetical protein
VIHRGDSGQGRPVGWRRPRQGAGPRQAERTPRCLHNGLGGFPPPPEHAAMSRCVGRLRETMVGLGPSGVSMERGPMLSRFVRVLSAVCVLAGTVGASASRAEPAEGPTGGATGPTAGATGPTAARPVQPAARQARRAPRHTDPDASRRSARPRQSYPQKSPM